METLLNLQGMIFLLMGVGLIVRKTGIITEEGQKCLTNLVINVILPCNIIQSFCVDFTKQMGRDIVAAFAVSVLIQALSVIYGKWMFQKEGDGRKKCLRYGMICSNAGFLGNPIAEGMFGAYGLMLASVFLIPLRTMMWTEGIAIFSGTKNPKETVRKTITHPCIVACFIGIILLITGLRFPVVLSKTIATIGACNTATSMMVIGMILSGIKMESFKDKTVWSYCFHRLALFPAIIFLILKILPVSANVLGISVLLTAMPAGATTSILSMKYEVEPEFGAKLVICSTLVSILTLTVWSGILI